MSNISATVTPGIVLLAGENGSGKTTIMKVLAGLFHPTSGECLINGVAADSNNPSEMGNTFFLDERMFFPGKTIREFAAMHSRFYPAFSNENFLHALVAFGLTGDEPMKSLSLGNLKKWMQETISDIGSAWLFQLVSAAIITAYLLWILWTIYKTLRRGGCCL